MRSCLRYLACAILLLSILSSCRNYRGLVTDEVVLKDGNSQTGTILVCDSINLKIKRMDESISIIPWATVDSVHGKKLRTAFVGANFGYYRIPYYSVFRHQAFDGERFGM